MLSPIWRERNSGLAAWSCGSITTPIDSTSLTPRVRCIRWQARNQVATIVLIGGE
jgi:hypothetical protein